MKHTIRINGEVKQIDCELGSGLKDRYGKEIVEDDLVRALKPNGEHKVGKVIFDAGTFWWASDRWETELNSDGIFDLEVVGHVEEG